MRYFHKVTICINDVTIFNNIMKKKMNEGTILNDKY